MATHLKSISIQGFKSIQNLDGLKLNGLNVLIGANGAGKSNFVDFFRLLRNMFDEKLQDSIAKTGSADSLFFSGPKVTNQIFGHLTLSDNEYRFTLRLTDKAGVVIASQAMRFEQTDWVERPSYAKEASMDSWFDSHNTSPLLGYGNYNPQEIRNWATYHFHDTTASAAFRRPQSARDFRTLGENAGNIAAFLLRIRQSEPEIYQRILYNTQLIAPYFEDFILEPEGIEGLEVIRLEWRQKGISVPMQPLQLSDGTLRFICLVTALLQPKLPRLMLFDEPELGLHPAAIEVVAELMYEASGSSQLIVATQSPAFVDVINPDDIVVVDRENEASTFTRLEESKLKDWLEDYTLGDLWRKNVFSGGPFRG